VAHLNLIIEDQLFIKGGPHLTEHARFLGRGGATPGEAADGKKSTVRWIIWRSADRAKNFGQMRGSQHSFTTFARLDKFKMDPFDLPVPVAPPDCFSG